MKIIHMPKVRQSSSYDCGPSVLRSICKLYKVVGPKTVKDFIKLCKSGKNKGTKPEDIISAALDLGLSVKQKNNSSIEELKYYIDIGIPIICCIQAWGDEVSYKARNSGHYVIVIGYDEEYLYLEDSWLHNNQGYLSYDNFIKRWKDQDIDGNKYNKFAIIVWKDITEFALEIL